MKLKHSRILPFAVLAALVPTVSLRASAAMWNIDAAGSWNSAGNWSGGVPNGTGAVAELSFNITANRSITLDGNKTVGDLKLGDPTPTTTTYHGYTLSAGTPVASRLIFDQTGTAAAKLAFPVTAATAVANTISAPIIQLNDSLEITSDVIATTNPTQTLSGIITDEAGSCSVTKKGPGLVTLGGANSYDGGTFVEAGKLTANTSGSFGTGTVTVAPGAQASLASTGAYANGFTISGNGAALGTNETDSTNLLGALRYANSVTAGTITVVDPGVAPVNTRIGAYNGAYGILSGPLAGSGALEINSNLNPKHNGILTLGGDASAFTGTITVTQGTLKLGTAAIGGSLVMKDGTTLVLNNALTNDSSPVIGTPAATKSLTLGTTSGTSLYVDPATTNPPRINGDVTLNGINTVYLTNACAGTSVTLLTYTGTLTGSTANLALAVGSGYRGAAFNVDTTGTPKKITLTMTSNALVWTGAANTSWDTSSNNWSSGTFMNGDNVTFDDDATGTGAVTVAIPTGGIVAPNKIIVANPTRDYTINGAGKIAGAAALIKNEAGKLTVANTTASTFTGGITLNAGTLAMSTAGFGTAAYLRIADGTTFTAASATAMAGTANADISGSVTFGDPAGTNSGAITLTGNHTVADNANITVSLKNSTVLTGSTRLPANLTVSTPFSGANNANLTFGGSSILSANTTITNSAAHNSSNAVSISGPLTDGAESFSLTKEGIGRLTLAAANTYDGGTTINDGLIYATHPLAFGSGAVTVVGTMSGGGQAYFSAGGLTPNAFFISGAGMTTSGLGNTSPDGALQLNTSNILTGPITLTGDARISGYLVTSATLGGVIGEDANGPWALDLGSPGAGNGSGTITVTNTNTYRGGTNVYRTTLRAWSNGAFGIGDVTVSGGNPALIKTIVNRLELGAGVTLDNNLVLSSDLRTHGTATTHTWGVVTAYPGDSVTPSTATLGGTVFIDKTPPNGGHFAVQGLATNVLRVMGEITATVPVIIANGTVELGGAGTNYLELQQWRDTLKVAATNGISTTAVVAQGAQAAATLDLNGFDQTLQGLTRPTGTNQVSVTNSSATTAATLTLAPSAAFTYPGTFVTGASALNLSLGGSAATVLTGVSSSFSGTTTVTAGGILELTGTLGGGASSLVTQSGATLRGKGVFGGNVTLGGGTKIEVNPAVAGNLTAGGDVTVTGPVTVDLSTSPAGPAVVISCAGTLTAAAGSFSAPGFPNASFTVVGKQVIVSISSDPLTWTGAGGSEWNLNQTANWTDGSTPRSFLNGFGAVFNDDPGTDQTIQVPGTVLPSSMTFGNATRGYTFTDSSAGRIQTGSLTKNGAGRVTFGVPVTVAGAMILNAGTVAIQSPDAGGSPVTLTSAISGAGTLVLAAGSGNPITVSGNNGSFSGSLAVSKGEVVLSGAASGGSGQLAVGDGSSGETDEPQLTLGAGVSVSNAVRASSAAMIARIAGAGNIGGSGSLAVEGPGILEVSTTNAYTGPTTVVAGTLQAAVIDAIPAVSTITLGTAASGTSDTTLVLPPASAAYQTTLSSPMVLGAAPASKASLRKYPGHAATYAGTVALNGRDLHVNSSGIRLGGVISGTGNLVIDTGDAFTPVTIGGTGNAFAGNVSVLSGNVQPSSGTAIPDTSSVLLGSGGVLSLGADETINGLTGPAGSAVQAGAHSLTVGAANSSFAFDGNWQSGTLVKQGTGILSLNGVNTATGNLEVRGGTVLVNQSSAARLDVTAGGTIGGDGSVFFAALPSGGHLPFNGFIEPGNQGIGSFTISNPLAFYGTAGFKLQLADWNSTTPGTGHDLLVCPKIIFSGTSVVVNLDCAGLTNFTEEERSFVVVQGDETIYPPGFNSVTFQVTNFPGSGTWKLGKAGVYDNTLRIYYTPPAGYPGWAAGKGLDSGNNGPSQDPDHDGLSNLEEFYLNGHPLAGDPGILPRFTRDGAFVEYAFDRLDAAEGEVATQVLEYGSSLGSWPNTAVIGTATTPADGNGVIVTVDEDGSNPDHITVRIPRTMEVQGRLFGRLKLVKP